MNRIGLAVLLFSFAFIYLAVSFGWQTFDVVASGLSSTLTVSKTERSVSPGHAIG